MSLNGFRWSPSALNLLSSCGEAFRRRYVEQERTPPSPRQIRGRVVHRAAQRTYLRQLEAHELPAIEEVKDFAATDFAAAWQEGVQLEPEERTAGEAATKGESLDFSVDLSGYHVQRVAPGIQPMAVEEAVAVRLPESNVTIHGVIDLIDLTPRGEVVRDLKTSEKTPNANAAEQSTQLTMYAALLKQELGHVPAALVLDYMVRTPAKKMKSFVPLVTTRDDEDLAVLGRRIQAAVALAESGTYLPASPDSWKCSERWCEYYPTCRYVRRGARPTT